MMGDLCQLLVPYPAERYVQALMTHEERLFTTYAFSSWGVVKKHDCGHYSGFVEIGPERRQLKPCFFTEEAADKFVQECGWEFEKLIRQRGHHSARFTDN